MVALEVVDQFVSPLGSQQRAGYYQQSKPFARLFGVTDQLLPDDYEGFQAHLRRMLHGPELAVDQTAQELAAAVLDGGSTASSGQRRLQLGTTPCPPWS